MLFYLPTNAILLTVYIF